jgi:hypothetical protein
LTDIIASLFEDPLTEPTCLNILELST